MQADPNSEKDVKMMGEVHENQSAAVGRLLARGNLVRQFLTTSHRRDTLLVLRGGEKFDSCHFNQADETLLQSSPSQRLSFEQGWSGRRDFAKVGVAIYIA